MTLALDIGNSAAKGVLFDGDRPALVFRLPDPAAFAEDLAGHLAGRPVTAAGIASVVPARTALLAEAVRQTVGREPLVVHAGLRLPFGMAYETPHTLGADRLAAAAGAVVLYGADPLVVVDAGTAVTVEVVAGGVYRGGAIAPGPDLLRRALAQGTAQLPEVDAVVPETAIGRSTREALQVGIASAFVGGVREVLARVEAELGARPLTVATGGWAALLVEHVAAIRHVESHLVPHGVRALVEANP